MERRALLSRAIVETADFSRVLRARAEVARGAYTFTVTRSSEDEVSAYVANGDGKSYGVTIAFHGTTCSCQDAMYRNVTCKHAIALALSLPTVLPEVQTVQEIKAVLDEAQNTIAHMRRYYTGSYLGDDDFAAVIRKIEKAIRKLNGKQLVPRQE